MGRTKGFREHPPLYLCVSQGLSGSVSVCLFVGFAVVAVLPEGKAAGLSVSGWGVPDFPPLATHRQSARDPQPVPVPVPVRVSVRFDIIRVS